jgi:hypothetical protein
MIGAAIRVVQAGMVVSSTLVSIGRLVRHRRTVPET